MYSIKKIKLRIIVTKKLMFISFSEFAANSYTTMFNNISKVGTVKIRV
jgi:hypothetical protein